MWGQPQPPAPGSSWGCCLSGTAAGGGGQDAGAAGPETRREARSRGCAGPETHPDSLSLAIPLYCLHIIVFLKSGKGAGERRDRRQ